jgi:hypothetical protein
MLALPDSLIDFVQCDVYEIKDRIVDYNSTYKTCIPDLNFDWKNIHKHKFLLFEIIGAKFSHILYTV